MIIPMGMVGMLMSKKNSAALRLTRAYKPDFSFWRLKRIFRLGIISAKPDFFGRLRLSKIASG